jgi:hypothetical protein
MQCLGQVFSLFLFIIIIIIATTNDQLKEKNLTSFVVWFICIWIADNSLRIDSSFILIIILCIRLIRLWRWLFYNNLKKKKITSTISLGENQSIMMHVGLVLFCIIRKKIFGNLTRLWWHVLLLKRYDDEMNQWVFVFMFVD